MFSNTEKAAPLPPSPLPMAVILAGGKGMRLRPLTDRLPKPLLPIGGKSVIGRILDNLEEEGVTKALILTGYKGEMIEKALRGRAGKLELLFVDEQGNLGSAGCVRKAKEYLENEFFVVCSDLYGRRNYRLFYEDFKSKNAEASMLVTRVGSPGEYGIVLKNREGRVTSFTEKPLWSRVFSNLANSGIYLMKKELVDLIPADRNSDFGGQFFPKLLREGRGVYAYEDKGLWRDVGDFRSYLACCLCENGGQSVLYGSAKVAPGARVRDSVLFSGASVGEDSTLDGCILDEGARVGRGCVLCSCVLGKNASVPDGAELPSGSILRPEETWDPARAGTLRVERKRVFSEPVLRFGGEGGKPCFEALGEALGEAVGKDGRVGVFYDEKRGCKRAAKSVLTGICRVLPGEDCGEMRAGGAGVLAASEGFSAALLVGSDGGMNEGESEDENAGEDKIAFTLFDSSGLPPSSSFLRRLRDAFSEAEAQMNTRENREDPKKAPLFSSFVPLQRANDLRAGYEAMLKNACFADLSGLEVGVGYESPPAALLSRVLLRVGARVGEKGAGTTRVQIYDDGRKAQITDHTGTLDFWHLSGLLLRREVEKGRRVLPLSYRTPRALFDLVSAHGGHVRPFALTPEGEDEAREDAMRLPFLYDGCFAAVCGLCLMRESGKSARDLRASLPDFCVMERSFDCPEEDKLELLLRSGWLPAGEGVDRREGRARLVLRALEGRGVQLTVEAAREQDARTMMERALREMKK